MKISIVTLNIHKFVNIIIQYSKIKNQRFRLVSEEDTRNLVFYFSETFACEVISPVVLD